MSELALSFVPQAAYVFCRRAPAEYRCGCVNGSHGSIWGCVCSDDVWVGVWVAVVLCAVCHLVCSMREKAPKTQQSQKLPAAAAAAAAVAEYIPRLEVYYR